MATHPIRATDPRNNSEELSRATTGLSMSNYPPIYGGFTEKAFQSPRSSPARTSSPITLGEHQAVKYAAASTASRS
jgi:hypothetical protein